MFAWHEIANFLADQFGGAIWETIWYSSHKVLNHRSIAHEGFITYQILYSQEIYSINKIFHLLLCKLRPSLLYVNIIFDDSAEEEKIFFARYLKIYRSLICNDRYTLPSKEGFWKVFHKKLTLSGCELKQVHFLSKLHECQDASLMYSEVGRLSAYCYIFETRKRVWRLPAGLVSEN